MEPDEWPKVKLADVCKSVDYGYTAAGSTDPIGPKFLRITDIVSGTIDWKAVPYCLIDGKDANRFGLHHGDVVVARTGATTGVSAYIAEPPDAVFASYLVRLQVGSDADPRFISYFLKSPHFWSYMRGVLGDKSAQPNASARTMTQVTLRLPPLAEQRAIAHILGTLDDKIELNRRMNVTLEAMARAIFKSWFVHFDSVRAKAEGRDPPGIDAETAALFPDSFEDSPLGKIPKGWRVGTVADLGEVICGKTPPTGDSDNFDGDVPFITIPDMHGRVFVVRTGTYLSQKGADTQPKKWLPPLTVCVSCIATPGLMCLTSERSHTNQQINSIVCGQDVSPYWCYFQMGTMRDEIITGGAGGSATLNLNKSQFSSMRLIIPPAPVMLRFHHLVQPVFGRILASQRESQTLADIRDTLLPKLLSGQIRVKGAEKLVEAHA